MKSPYDIFREAKTLHELCEQCRCYSIDDKGEMTCHSTQRRQLSDDGITYCRGFEARERKLSNEVCNTCEHYSEGWCDQTGWATDADTQCICPARYGKYAPLSWTAAKEYMANIKQLCAEREVIVVINPDYTASIFFNYDDAKIDAYFYTHAGEEWGIDVWLHNRVRFAKLAGKESERNRLANEEAYKIALKVIKEED